MEESSLTTEKMLQVDSGLWAHVNQLQLRDGIKFSLKGMPYLADLINCDKRIINVKKGAQVCMTTTFYIDAIHACYYGKYNQNVMYMMPDKVSVEKLCSASFDPIFDCNPWLKKHVTTNNTVMKEINGRSVVFVGAQPKFIGGQAKDSSSLRSMPCDCIFRDEIDLMDKEIAYMSKQRLKRSVFKHERNFGSPTIPGLGIDKLYEESDQRKWQIECKGCGGDTCLGETFPCCIKLVDGKWKRVCVHCGDEIFVADGRWIAEYPERREAGFWIDGLMSPLADLDDYMYDYTHAEGSNLCEFMRSTIGVATSEDDAQLTEQQVLNKCNDSVIQASSIGETVMGCDVEGNILHVVIGLRTGRDSYDILNLSTVKDFHELSDLAKQMNVHHAVIDSMPAIHAARDFAMSQPYSVHLCQYIKSETGKTQWNNETKIVKVNRTEWCDKVHSIFNPTEQQVILPRNTPLVSKYAHQMTQTAKRTESDPRTGIAKPAKWIKLPSKNDHFFHATLYFLLAASRASIRTRSSGAIKRYTKQICNYGI